MTVYFGSDGHNTSSATTPHFARQFCTMSILLAVPGSNAFFVHSSDAGVKKWADPWLMTISRSSHISK